MSKFSLIGIPNCGKTTLGKKIAEKLSLPFYDTDEMMRKTLALKTLAEIYRADYEDRFIEAQYKAVVKLSKLKGPALISTGAEVALIPECAALLKKMGPIIYIQRKTELALASVSWATAKGRYKDSCEIYMNEQAIRVYSKEIHQYEALADASLDNNGSEDEGVEKLAALIAETQAG